MDEPLPDLGSLSDDELKGQINELAEQPATRLVHAELDIVRAELVRRVYKKWKRDGGEWPPADWPPELGPRP
jgi:hypothetical protein